MSDGSRWGEVDSLFDAALDLPADRRAAYLDEHCDDPELRAHVERLLVLAQDQTDLMREAGALDGSIGQELRAEGARAALRGRQLGPYRLRRKLGEGGMGEVWEADQTAPVRRRVAVKLIRPDRNTDSIAARFEAERQALARMNHPNVARVLDAGTSDEGRPYFVMEYVAGVPLTEYCDQNRLDTRERLELLIDVCSGVQHAHHKGIIHRDLKPSNVLVTVEQDRPVPKIIDFGVARATDQRLTEQTFYTEFGQMIGTPGYMSPEQAEMSGVDIDTRTDVYALGVLLYEMLSGFQPFDPEQLQRDGFDEMRRRIRETDPLRPSARLATLEQVSSQDAARVRGTDTATLVRRLRGDLDWIVMRAIEKDRTRRYASPNDLAADIRRHLDDEPVLAGPPSVTYRLGKLVRRRRGTVAAGLAVGITMVVGTLVSVDQAIRATRAEQRALAEAETARQVSTFLVDLFRDADPGKSRGRTITAREVLERGAQRLSTDLGDQPQVRARLLTSIGLVYNNLGLYEEAAPLIAQARALREAEFGPASIEVGESFTDTGNTDYYRGDYEAALAAYQRSAEIFEAAGDAGTELLARALNNIALTQLDLGRPDEAEAYARRSLELRRSLTDVAGELLAANYGVLGSVAKQRADYDAAREAFERSLDLRTEALGSDHFDVGRSLNDLATVADTLGEFEEARRLFERALEIFETSLGPDHSHVAVALNNLGNVSNALGDPEARTYYQRALDINERALGPDHPTVAANLNNLALTVHAQGDSDEALAMHRRALAIRESRLGPTHPVVVASLNNIGMVLGDTGDLAGARPYHERALDIIRSHYGPDHVQVALTEYNLGDLIADLGELDAAVAHLRKAHDLWSATFPAEHPYVEISAGRLAEVLRQAGRDEEARRYAPDPES